MRIRQTRTGMHRRRGSNSRPESPEQRRVNGVDEELGRMASSLGDGKRRDGGGFQVAMDRLGKEERAQQPTM